MTEVIKPSDKEVIKPSDKHLHQENKQALSFEKTYNSEVGLAVVCSPLFEHGVRLVGAQVTLLKTHFYSKLGCLKGI